VQNDPVSNFILELKEHMEDLDVNGEDEINIVLGYG
jgi:hypothetical protein